PSVHFLKEIIMGNRLKKATKAIEKVQKKYDIPVDDTTRGTVTFETWDLLYSAYCQVDDSFAAYQFALDKYGEEYLRMQLYDNVLVEERKLQIYNTAGTIGIIALAIIAIVSLFTIG